MAQVSMENRGKAQPASFPWERLAAVAYVFWGLWHLPIVWSLWDLGAGQEDLRLGLRLQQGAFHILFFALVAIVVGGWLNWRNSRSGYWINLITISWTEVGLFYLFMLPGWIGPAVWLLALGASTRALFVRPSV